MRQRKLDADVIVIGGGASGLMAAGRAAELGAEVLLLEKTDGVGKKIMVSGKTRCNLTNNADLKKFIDRYGSHGRFLYGAFHRFFREELLAFFARYGLQTKTERGGRIFPCSDDARDVVRVFRKYLAENKVKMVLQAAVRAVEYGQNVFSVQTTKGRYGARAVILATGGASWPITGSTGDGYRLAEHLGHRVVTLRPALVPLIVKEKKLAQAVQGVSLRHVRAAAFRGRAEDIDIRMMPQENYGRGETKQAKAPLIESRFGEMIFTHFGLSGPIILLMSLAIVDALQETPVSVIIDLKPAVTAEQLGRRLQRDFDLHGKRKLSGTMKEYLPAKMIKPIIALAGIDEETPAHRISGSQRKKLVATLKGLRFNIEGPLPLEKAIVTAGGVALEEIDPRTMASKKIPGLYFCGEVIDLDADTGGYNLQAAFSTGYVAGESAAKFVQG